MKNNLLKCWKPLKPYLPQRSDEKCTCVMATKVERNDMDGIWLNPTFCKMGNQQLSSEQEKAQRLSREGVDRKRLAVEVVGIRKDEDIVFSLLKKRAYGSTGKE